MVRQPLIHAFLRGDHGSLCTKSSSNEQELIFSKPSPRPSLSKCNLVSCASMLCSRAGSTALCGTVCQCQPSRGLVKAKIPCPLYALYRRAPKVLFPSYMVANVQSRIADLKPELQQKYLAEIPLRRVATPDEVADAALFLAANQYANNCVVNLDGGLSAV